MTDLGQIAAALLLGFALGSVPFGYVLVRLRTGDDVRDAGSGNIGATNVSRVLGTSGGIATLALDALKGGVAVWGAVYLGLDGSAAALGAVLGHCYTPWLRGRGGKGVATLLGSFGVLVPLAALSAILALLVGVALTRMMSVGSFCVSVALVGAVWWRAEPTATLVAATASMVVIIWRHRENWRRIVQGTESKLGATRS